MTRTPKTEDHYEFVKSGALLAFDHFSPEQVIDGYIARYPATSEFTFQFEGGYVNDPDDPGGCTNMGITIGTLQAWRNDPGVNCEDVKALTKLEAQLIYATNYWAPVWGNKLPIGLNTQVYDFGVNAGPSRSIKKLQDCVGTVQDGIMGNDTANAVEQYINERGEEALLINYHDIRQDYYESLSTFDKYGNGWTSRNDACLELARQLAESTDIAVPPIDLPVSEEGLEGRVVALEAWAASFKRTFE